MKLAMSELMILLLLLPGVVFAVGVSIRDWMDTLVRAGFGVVASIGILLFMCGLASVILTPAGIAWGLMHRAWRSPNAYRAWVVLSVASAIGVLLMIGHFGMV
jgi:hypothetical protein